MPRKPVDFDTVKELAMAMPDVAQSTSWGVTSFKVGGGILACPAIHASAEEGSLLVRIDFNLRAELLAADPDVYYVTPHYENYPSVLVRLSRISRKTLRDLLGTAWVFASSSSSSRRATTAKKSSGHKRR
jgi:hypothetical protein